ncbi:WbqC-like protein family protein [Bacteroidales bacterium Barb6]|nr:WbqC-like protein family protein [Bacteroidales bacterium Barb6]
MLPVYLATAYLAPVQYYTKLFRFADVRIETCENYLKQTYRNRCTIAAANGTLSLSIPIVKPDTPKCLTKDIRISDHGNWRHLHWNALVSAYSLSPFFEYYEDDFAPFYRRRYNFLFDFNNELLQTVCRLLDMEPRISLTEDYRPDLPNDFRETICPKHEGTDTTFFPQPYHQVFCDKYSFLPNLSIIDLLFNMGPEAVLILRDSYSYK